MTKTPVQCAGYSTPCRIITVNRHEPPANANLSQVFRKGVFRLCKLRGAVGIISGRNCAHAIEGSNRAIILVTSTIARFRDEVAPAYNASKDEGCDRLNPGEMSPPIAASKLRRERPTGATFAPTMIFCNRS